MFKIEKFDLLVSLYIFCICVSELMGSKTFPLFNIGSFHLNASVAIFVIPLIFTINDIIVEVKGKERARSVVKSGLLVVGLIFLYAALTVHLPPSMRFASQEAAYDTIFGQTMRIALASLTAFAVSDFMDVYIFAKIREKMHKKALWFRNNLSNFLAQLLDTVVFMTLAFYAFDQSLSSNLSFLIGISLPYWLIRCGISVIETPLVYIGVKWLKKP